MKFPPQYNQARGLGVLVQVGFSLIMLNHEVWGRGPAAGGETGRFLRTRTSLEAFKSHYFANNESTDDLNFIKICGMPLKEEIETKFLGFTIDNELTWQAILIMFTKNLNLQQEC